MYHNPKPSSHKRKVPHLKKVMFLKENLTHEKDALILS